MVFVFNAAFELNWLFLCVYRRIGGNMKVYTVESIDIETKRSVILLVFSSAKKAVKFAYDHQKGLKPLFRTKLEAKAKSLKELKKGCMSYVHLYDNDDVKQRHYLITKQDVI